MNRDTVHNARPWCRRDVLKVMGAGGAILAADTLAPQTLLGLSSSKRRSLGALAKTSIDPMIVIDGTDVRTIAMRALDAAKAAGARYADVRLTRQLSQNFLGNRLVNEGEQLGVGVRALVHGAWGFAASPYWDAEDVVRVARNAAQQATANAQMASRAEAWTPIPVASGGWATPIKVDPFILPLEERQDLMDAWGALASRYRRCKGWMDLTLGREERAVATTDGAYFTQTLYQTGGKFELLREGIYGYPKYGQASATGLTTTAAGWELLTEADIPAQIPQLYEEADPNRPALPFKPGNVGRYDVVFDATVMCSLVSQTIGTAAQVDRALGYEANAGGTSYLGPDPLALLGTYQAASPLVTITANRSMSRGLATVKWDDEGVTPDDFPLVKSGVLVDYQTTREQAEWLASWYQKQGRPVRSHGCAAAQSALSITMQHMPNLVLEPGPHQISFDDLVADTKRGLAVIGSGASGGGVHTDFQARTGIGGGEIREIVNGKLGSEVYGLGFLFEATELWKNVKAIGGLGSVMQVPGGDWKGEPGQGFPHSLRAVPAKIINVDFIDPKRKA